MRKLILNPIDYSDNLKLMYRGFLAGIGWAFGVTIGFVIVSVLLVFVLRNVNAIPYVGGIIASLVEVVLEQLAIRTPGFTN